MQFPSKGTLVIISQVNDFGLFLPFSEYAFKNHTKKVPALKWTGTFFFHKKIQFIYVT